MREPLFVYVLTRTTTGGREQIAYVGTSCSPVNRALHVIGHHTPAVALRLDMLVGPFHMSRGHERLALVRLRASIAHEAVTSSDVPCIVERVLHKFGMAACHAGRLSDFVIKSGKA